jgi:MOSC domain-containing protein YiiM
MAQVLSVNVGSAQSIAGGKGKPTGIGKVPVASVEVRDPGPKRGGLGSGVVGDFLGDRDHHGGSGQAVYAFAREELDAWGVELGRELPDGTFGENLTTSGLDVDAALVGERWAVGDSVVLAVTGPRVPCRTFAARMQEPHWVRRFAERGRSGAYLAVEVPGTVRAGDGIRLLSRPDHDVDVPTTLRAFLGDVAAARRVIAAGLYEGADRKQLERTAARPD